MKNKTKENNEGSKIKFYGGLALTVSVISFLIYRSYKNFKKLSTGNVTFKARMAIESLKTEKDVDLTELEEGIKDLDQHLKNELLETISLHSSNERFESFFENCKSYFDQSDLKRICCDLCNSKNSDKLLFFIENNKDFDYNECDFLGRSALLECSSNGDLEKFNLLMQIKGIDVNIKDLEMNTPLHLASKNGEFKIFSFFIKIYVDCLYIS